MEKKMKLYAYKIENDKISTSHSDFYDKIALLSRLEIIGPEKARI